MGFFNELGTKIKDDGMLTFIDSSQTFAGSTIPYGVRTGVPMLDLALGRPGWAAGRVVELYGFEGCGKTTLGLHAIAQVQRMGGMGIFIDSELTFDPYRANQIGVSQKYGEDFARIEARSVEAGFRAIQGITNAIKESGETRPMVVLYDSVTGSNLEYNITRLADKKSGYAFGAAERIGQEAKSIRTGMRTISADISATKIVLIFINHAVATIAGTYAKASQAAGGHAIKLFASTRCELKKSTKIKDSDKNLLGAETNIFIEKSKVGGVSIENVKVELMNTYGFDTVGNLLEAAKESGMVEWPAKAKTGTLKFIDPGRVVSKADWGQFVEESGGVDEVYSQFYRWCFQNGLMRPYGEVSG